MSDKQRLLDAVAALPESANWAKITDALLDHLANTGAIAEYAMVYKATLTADDLAEHLNPKLDHNLADVVAEIEARHGKRGQA